MGLHPMCCLFLRLFGISDPPFPPSLPCWLPSSLDFCHFTLSISLFPPLHHFAFTPLPLSIFPFLFFLLTFTSLINTISPPFSVITPLSSKPNFRPT